MDVDTCSAKGCQDSATWQVRWNNPKLHTPERLKVWLACDVHRTTLADFLAARSFLKDVVAHDPTDPSDPPNPTDPGASAADR